MDSVDSFFGGSPARVRTNSLMPEPNEPLMKDPVYYLDDDPNF